MSLESLPWRADDVVRFEVAREVVNTATAALFELADFGAIELSRAVAEARDIRLDLLSIDGFDREAVDDFIVKVTAQIAGLEAAGQ